MKLNINVEGLLFVKYIFSLTMFGSIVYKFFRIFPTETCVCYGLAVYMVSYFAVSFFNITFDVINRNYYRNQRPAHLTSQVTATILHA